MDIVTENNQRSNFVINAIASDFDYFNVSDQGTFTQFINITKDEYDKKKLPCDVDYNISNNNDIYTLLLRAAIALNKEDIVEKILSQDHGNILTQPDATSYSPLSQTLYSGKKSILNKIKNYIDQYKDNFIKIKCEEDDKANIITIMRYPQFENLTKEFYKELLEPLYNDISPFTDLLDTFVN